MQNTLSADQQSSIWRAFLDRIDPDDILNTSAIHGAIKDVFSTYQLSGRQIRNVISFALSDARAEKRKLSEGDLFRSLGVVASQEYELDLVTDGSFYTPALNPGQIGEPDLQHGGNMSLPSDDRLELSFTTDSISMLKSALGANFFVLY